MEEENLKQVVDEIQDLSTNNEKESINEKMIDTIIHDYMHLKEVRDKVDQMYKKMAKIMKDGNYNNLIVKSYLKIGRLEIKKIDIMIRMTMEWKNFYTLKEKYKIEEIEEKEGKKDD